MRDLLDTGRSLLLTPLSMSGADVRTVPMPAGIRLRTEREPSNGWPDTDAERSAGMCGKCGHPEACAAMGCKTPNV